MHLNIHWCLPPDSKYDKSKVNHRARCLAITQVIKAKLYNSYLQFVYNFFIMIMWHHFFYSLSYSSSHIFLTEFLLTYNYIWVLGPLLHSLSCPICCLHENKALFSPFLLSFTSNKNKLILLVIKIFATIGL